MNKKYYNLLSVLVFAFILIVWQLISVFPKIKFFLASPILIWQSLVTNFSSLVYNSAVTGLETIVGLIIGVLLGVVIGFLLWYSVLVAKIFKPYIIIAGAVPAFAFAPIIILWFGIGIGMKIVMAAFGAFLITLTQSYEGANSVSKEEYRLFEVLKASRLQILKKVIFPSSLSWVLASIKLCVGSALLGAFIGEFISADKGLGRFMLRAGSLYDIPSVFAGAIFLVALAIILNYLVGLIENNRIKVVKFFSVDSSINKF